MSEYVTSNCYMLHVILSHVSESPANAAAVTDNTHQLLSSFSPKMSSSQATSTTASSEHAASEKVCQWLVIFGGAHQLFPVRQMLYVLSLDTLNTQLLMS